MRDQSDMCVRPSPGVEAHSSAQRLAFYRPSEAVAPEGTP